MPKLSEAEIRSRLKDLPGWELTPAGIRKTYSRADFKAAMRFVNTVAGLAEEANHHPDILIFGWNKVTFTLMTHSEKAVTEKDFSLAAQIERAAQ
jgi:4a-hydroxytetrahydrobiopterin dehydratase